MDASPLWYWMNERQAIKNRRDSGAPWPWSDDEILNTYSFCQVYREDDRVSRWLIDNWYSPNQDHPNLWLACCIARQINWPDTLEEIGFPHEMSALYVSRAIEVMNDRAQRGEKVYTGAYMIYGGPGAKKGYPDKASWTWNRVLKPLADARAEYMDNVFQTVPPDARSLELAVEYLTIFDGWSGFMADQAVADMTYTPLFSQAMDRLTWAHPGPGCQRGINRLLTGSSENPSFKVDYLSVMNELLQEATGENSPLGEHVLSAGHPFTVHVIESGLCEVDKYLRTKNQEGTPRAKFIPPQSRKG